MDKARTQEAAVRIMKSIYDSIKESGPAGIPAGTVYAALLPGGCTLRHWESIEATLIGAGLVVKKGDLLVAVSS